MAADRTLIGAETGIKRAAGDSGVDVLLATPGEKSMYNNFTKRFRQSRHATGADKGQCSTSTSTTGGVSKPEAATQVSGFRDDVTKTGRTDDVTYTSQIVSRHHCAVGGSATSVLLRHCCDGRYGPCQCGLTVYRSTPVTARARSRTAKASPRNPISASSFSPQDPECRRRNRQQQQRRFPSEPSSIPSSSDDHRHGSKINGETSSETASRSWSNLSADESTGVKFQSVLSVATLTSEINRLNVFGYDQSHSEVLLIGTRKFNFDGKSGIKYLQQNNLLGTSPADIAQFLHDTDGLSRTVIGDYLCDGAPFNVDVLRAYSRLYDFKNIDLLSALRVFLSRFRLPGESQQIDRVVTYFTQQYCEANPDTFTCTDTCYMLAYLALQLNTCLHNPNVKIRPTLETFVSTNVAHQLSAELLTKLYESIKCEPFKVPDEETDQLGLMLPFFNPIKCGWLYKRGGRYKSWKLRWFLLKDKCLYYFKCATDKLPKGIIPLENVGVRDAVDRSKPNCFELFASHSGLMKACKTTWDGRVVQGKHHVFRMSAKTYGEQQQWMQTLRATMSDSVLHDLLTRRQ